MKKVIEQVDKFGNVSFQVGRDGISLIQIADGTTKSTESHNTTSLLNIGANSQLTVPY